MNSKSLKSCIKNETKEFQKLRQLVKDNILIYKIEGFYSVKFLSLFSDGQ